MAVFKRPGTKPLKDRVGNIARGYNRSTLTVISAGTQIGIASEERLFGCSLRRKPRDSGEATMAQLEIPGDPDPTAPNNTHSQAQ
jgi:hypothetical protein